MVFAHGLLRNVCDLEGQDPDAVPPVLAGLMFVFGGHRTRAEQCEQLLSVLQWEAVTFGGFNAADELSNESE